MTGEAPLHGWWMECDIRCTSTIALARQKGPLSKQAEDIATRIEAWLESAAADGKPPMTEVEAIAVLGELAKFCEITRGGKTS